MWVAFTVHINRYVNVLLKDVGVCETTCTDLALSRPRALRPHSRNLWYPHGGLCLLFDKLYASRKWGKGNQWLGKWGTGQGVWSRWWVDSNVRTVSFNAACACWRLARHFFERATEGGGREGGGGGWPQVILPKALWRNVLQHAVSQHCPRPWDISSPNRLLDVGRGWHDSRHPCPLVSRD